MSQDECAQAWSHGNPFRYCACGWIEPEADTVSQDGTWQERNGIPQEPEPPRATKSDLLERVRRERDEAEQQAARMETIVAALVRKFGEQARQDLAWRVALTEAELTSVQSGHLRVMVDPNSGAMLLRYERPL